MFTVYVLAGIVIGVVLFVLAGLRIVPNTRVGIVEKKLSLKGSIKSGFIALHGEAGFQPDVMRGGWHWLMPFQYRVHRQPLVTIPQGKIGYVFARDGQPLGPTQTLGSNLQADSFEDVRAFLANGGQRGPQRKILREGTYAINLAQFVVITESHLYYLPMTASDVRLFQNMAGLIADRGGFEPVILRGTDDEVGIVTTHDGPALSDGEIIAGIAGNDPTKSDTYHNNFQDAERFLLAGGRRGRQLQVLVEGTYYINRLFATVELIAKTVVEVGYVGVVVSYTGELGADLSGDDYKHGELVKTGQRGVWSHALMPGKYAFNTFAGKVIMVPTTNFILKWIENQTGNHRFDENLSEVALITKDAFEPLMPLSVVVHIDYRKAPLVIQRFGDIKRLVEQTLDPMVSAYFKNIAQTRTLIHLIHERAEIQEHALQEMRVKFAEYNLELQEVLIGTPEADGDDTRFETILSQLRQRQIALEQIETYERQQAAAVKERELREAEARARQQQAITESELSVTIQSNEGKAEYQRAVQQAARVRTMAEAKAAEVTSLAEAEAGRAARVGVAQAIAIDEQVRAYGGPQFQLTQQVMTRFAEAIQAAHVDVVPRIVVGGSSGGNGPAMDTGLIQSLLAMLLSEKLGGAALTPNSPRNPEAESLRREIMTAITPVNDKPAAENN